MTRLRCQVEKEILTAEQMPQAIAAPDIGDVDGYAISDVGDIGEVAAVFGDHAVNQQYFCIEQDEAPCDCRADKAQAADDDRPGSAISFEPLIRLKDHLGPPSRLSFLELRHQRS